MSQVVLQTSTSCCTIDSTGCGITQLILQGKKVLWSGTRPDGGKGFTHPCIPNFNLADGLPNHGPARKAEWTQESGNSFSWQMEEIAGVYAAGLRAVRQFTLNDSELIVTTEITNRGVESLPINIAEHHYFACSSEKRSAVTVNTVSFDANALEGRALYQLLSSSTLQIAIQDLGTIEMQVEGYQAFAQWSLPKADFVCVEPIQTMPPEPAEFKTIAPVLLPGETKMFRYSIQLLPNE
jgi:galactose mutarotase-like enzyme